MTRMAMVLLSVSLLAVPALAEASAPRWELDNRRCRVLARYDGVIVDITNASGKLELSIFWHDEEQRVSKTLTDYEGDNLYFRIDGEKSMSLDPLRAETGVPYGYYMGRYEDLAPAIARGKTLNIGNGKGLSLSYDLTGSKKAIKFLKECQLFWERWHKKRR